MWLKSDTKSPNRLMKKQKRLNCTEKDKETVAHHLYGHSFQAK
jgi:hypothetical protein